MAEWEGKSKGLPLGYQFFVVVLRYLGVYPAYFFLYLVVPYYFFFSWKTSRPTLDFFRKRMGFSWLSSFGKLFQTYFLIGQVVIDKVVVMSGLSKKFTSESFGAENLKELVSRNKGGILLGAHLGNWEIAGHYLLNYNNKINIVMYDGEDQRIKEYLESVTGGRKYNVITIKNDLSHIYAISEALERNEIICMHADRFVKGTRTSPVNFFGEEAPFPQGPFQLIKTFKASYTFVYGIKKSTTHYNFFARPVRQVQAGATVQSLMEDYVHDLEGMVKQYPTQWFNYYDFWKKNDN